MIFKILLTNSESVKHCQLISSVVGVALSKLEAIKSAFQKYPNSFTNHVLKWARGAKTLLKFQRLMSFYLLNKAQESNAGGNRTKVYEQIYHENYIVGKEIEEYFHKYSKELEIGVFIEKYETQVLKDIAKYGHLVDEIKDEYKKMTIADMIYDGRKGQMPDTVRNMIYGKAGITV